MDFYKSKKTELPAPQQLDTPEAKTARSLLSQLMSGANDFTLGESYGGQINAPFEGYEELVPGLLEDFIGRSTPKSWENASAEINRTLTGDYDPTTSEYYKGTKDKMLRELEEATTRLNQSWNVGGNLRNSRRVDKGVRGLESDYLGNMSELLFGLQERERDKRLSVLPFAETFGRLQEESPIRSLEAINQYSQRDEKQGMLDREYNEWLRSREESKGKIDLAQFLASPSNYNFYQPQYDTEASPFERFVMPLAQTAISATGMAMASSKDFKKDISKVSEDELEKILEKIEETDLYNFKYKEGISDDKQHVGVITEESPREIVTSDGKHLDLIDVTGFLIASVKALSKKVRELEKGGENAVT
jgi:hypothetical protein